jgi:hypothetical protein
VLSVRAFARKVQGVLRNDFWREAMYQRALDDVWDGALDRYNPCHDRVREWIVKRREEIAAEGLR